MTFTRAVPNFLSQMQRSGEQVDVGGIEGALARDAAKKRARADENDREDGDDEAPVVVDATEALSSKERKKLEQKNGGSGSLKFKGDDTSAAAKFQESAHARVLEEAARKAAVEAEEEEAKASGGKVVFRAKPKGAGKRKAGADGSGSQKVGAKTLKNTKLLSFNDGDEEDEG